MGGISLWQLVILLMILSLSMLPLLLLALSSRVHGMTKLGWLMVVACTSWLGLGVFFISTSSRSAREIS